MHRHIGVEDPAERDIVLLPAQTPTEVHQPPAFGVDGSPSLDEGLDRGAHGGIGRQGVHAVFGKAATDEEPLHRGQARVMHRAERDEHRPGGLQGLQVIVIVKTEGLVPGDSDAYPFRRHTRRTWRLRPPGLPRHPWYRQLKA